MITKIFIPKMGANIDKAQIGKICTKEGDDVKKGDILMEMVTDKATFDIEADASGKILKLLCREKDEVNVLDIVGFIGNEGDAIPQIELNKAKAMAEARTATISLDNASEPETGKVKATPGARKLAREKGIDLESEFRGSAKIIREEDLHNLLNNDTIELKEQGFRKKAEVEHLSKSKEYIYSAVTLQISAAKAKQKALDCANEKHLRLSLGEYICHNAASLLNEFQNLNAYYTQKGVCTYNNINIGIAMSPQEELIVPVIKNADKLSLPEFLDKYSELLLKTIKGTITADDISEGTFTITDLSAYGAFDFIPVINDRQSAILCISAEHDSCSMADGKLTYDPKINLTVAFDHRATDGKYALLFLQKLKDRIE